MNLNALHAERALVERGTEGLDANGVYELYKQAYDDEDIAQRAATRHALAQEIAKAKYGSGRSG